MEIYIVFLWSCWYHMTRSKPRTYLYSWIDQWVTFLTSSRFLVSHFKSFMICSSSKGLLSLLMILRWFVLYISLVRGLNYFEYSLWMAFHEPNIHFNFNEHHSSRATSHCMKCTWFTVYLKKDIISVHCTAWLRNWTQADEIPASATGPNYAAFDGEDVQVRRMLHPPFKRKNQQQTNNPQGMTGGMSGMTMREEPECIKKWKLEQEEMLKKKDADEEVKIRDKW